MLDKLSSYALSRQPFVRFSSLLLTIPGAFCNEEMYSLREGQQTPRITITLATPQTPPACYRSRSGPSGRSVPGVSLEVSLGPFGPRALECPKCPRSVKKVSRTLWGHSRDIFWTLRSPGPEGPQRHPEGHSRDTPGPKGLRDSCSRPGGFAALHTKRLPSQIQNHFGLVILPPIVPKIFLKAVRQGIRKSCAHTTHQDQVVPETDRFGNHRAGITENNSKRVKFGSVIILCPRIMNLRTCPKARNPQRIKIGQKYRLWRNDYLIVCNLKN